MIERSGMKSQIPVKEVNTGPLANSQNAQGKRHIKVGRGCTE